MREALPLFQAAVAWDPSEVSFLSNLGVTYMRLGQSDQALTQFIKALQLKPAGEDAFVNLKELAGLEKFDWVELLVERGMHAVLSARGKSDAAARARANAKAGTVTTATTIPRSASPAPQQPEEVHAAPSGASDLQAVHGLGQIRHHVRPLPRIPASRLYEPEFVEFARGKRPFILTGLASKFPVTGDAAALQQVFDQFGEEYADYYPQSMGPTGGSRPYIVKLRQAVRELTRPSAQFPRHDSGSQYVHWNVRWEAWNNLTAHLQPTLPFYTSDDAWIDGCLPSAKLRNEHHLANHWRMVLIGNHGAGMFNHLDTLRTSSFQYQLLGAKVWHLCGPKNTPILSKQPKTQSMFNPDYAAAPELLDLDCYLDVAAEGDTLYYPRDYWHQTLNQGQLVVAVTGTLVDENNYDSVSEQLAQDCARPEDQRVPLIHSSPELCKYYRQHCFPWWEHAYNHKARAWARPSEQSTRGLTCAEPGTVVGELTCSHDGSFELSEMTAPQSTSFYGLQ